MRVTWLLDPAPGAEWNDLSGLQADALAARGHEVRIATAEKPLSMFGGHRAEWLEVDDWRILDVAADDFVVATSPRTARIAEELAPGRAVESLDVGPLLVEAIYRAGTPREHHPPRLLLPGASQEGSDSVSEGYGAVAHARWFHQKLDLIRVAPWAPSREEPLNSVQEFHVGLSPEELIRLLHSCDLVIAPGRTFVAAAAMAAGIPCLTQPARSAVDLGETLIEVLTDEQRRDDMRGQGREAAEPWRAEGAGERLESALRAAAR